MATVINIETPLLYVIGVQVITLAVVQ